MNKFKGTPGPWVAVMNTDLDLPSGSIKSGDKSIAHTLQKATGSEQARANANLIATSPELLGVLIEISEMQKLNYGDGMTTHIKLKEIVRRADLLIKKALGE